MSLQAKWIITILLSGNAVLVIELLRRRRLNESYTILWLFIILGTTIATWSDRLLDFLTWFFGAIAPVNALTLLSLVFILVMLIFFSMKISQLTRELKDLAQQVALRTPVDKGQAGGEGNR